MSSKGFEQGYYAEMEDENLNVKNYIETKLNLKIWQNPKPWKEKNLNIR